MCYREGSRRGRSAGLQQQQLQEQQYQEQEEELLLLQLETLDEQSRRTGFPH